MALSPCWSSSDDSSSQVRDTTSNAALIRLFDRTESHHIHSSNLGTGYHYSYRPIPHQPLWLTDAHLAPELVLRNIVYVSTIPHDMLEDFHLTWTRYLSENHVFPQYLPKYLYSDLLRGIDGPSAVLRTYMDQIADHSSRFAFKLYIHPDQTRWDTAFRMEECSRFDVFLKEAKLYVEPDSRAPNDFSLAQSVAKALNPSVVANLRYLRDNRETLAVFNFIPPCSTADDMFSSSRLEKDCEWTTPATESPMTLPPFIPPNQLDAKQKWWSEYDSNSKKIKSRMKTTVRPAGLKRAVWVPPHKGTRTQYQPDTSHFLQRTWCRAVENDATFIVLNTGNSERVGIRHRATNTLFLGPPLLKPFEPPYMRYHMALYAAIIDDAFSRLHAKDASQSRSHKRRARDDKPPTRTSKRLRGEGAPSVTTCRMADIDVEIATRHILLVSFDFGPFHSPAPSSFLRASSSCHPDFVSQTFLKPNGNRKYALTKCLNFVAKGKVGHGATGTVYRGHVEMETPNGWILEDNVVIKIPLGTKPANRIHGEYEIYEQLALAGVTAGIVKVYGVFEDIETGSVALLMQYAGTNLLLRERIRIENGISLAKPQQITLSQEEFDQLFTVLKSINNAGILHNDLKPDNIVVNDDGHLSIIDFDTTRELQLYKPGNYKESPDIVTLRDMFAGNFLKDKRYLR